MLLEKERRWAPVAYVVFGAAVLAILAIAYTSFAFSSYRSVILPGVRVDQVSLSGLTESQARNRLIDDLDAIYFVPVRLIHKGSSGTQIWKPNKKQIGLEYNVNATASTAMSVGRHESFFEQLFDRMPIHPDHSVALLYKLQEKKLSAYIEGKAATIAQPALNARL
ncbi:MAG: peptidoglycan binding domain-containing protein, partial [Chloroflexota bacterium]